jgi:hypothetical protein
VLVLLFQVQAQLWMWMRSAMLMMSPFVEIVPFGDENALLLLGDMCLLGRSEG